MGDWGGEELLWAAVEKAVSAVQHRDVQFESDKIQKRIRDYFKKGAKNLQFAGGKPWQELIKDYTDAVASSAYTGLGDREWLPQLEFIYCVDAGIKDMFPPHVLANVAQQEFEECVWKMTDRSFDEQRYCTWRWETIQRVVTGKATQKRVRENLDAARWEAVEAEPGQLDGFIRLWIAAATRLIAEASSGNPRSTLDEGTASDLFHALIQEGALPKTLVDQEGVPSPGWPVVDAAIMEAYALYPSLDGAAPWMGGGKRGCKGKGGPPAPAGAWGMGDAWGADAGGGKWGGGGGGWGAFDKNGGGGYGPCSGAGGCAGKGKWGPYQT